MFFFFIISSTLLCSLYCTTQTDTLPKMTQNNGACKNEINHWNVSINCGCPNKLTYDKKTGFCFSNNDLRPSIIITRKISSGIIAIGAETTGFIIKSNTEIYELILKKKDKKAILENPKLLFKIEGEVVILPSIERKNRKAIIVNRLVKKNS